MAEGKGLEVRKLVHQHTIESYRNLEAHWEVQQRATFTQWVNYRLELDGHAQIDDIVTGIADGTTLVCLCTVMPCTSPLCLFRGRA